MMGDEAIVKIWYLVGGFIVLMVALIIVGVQVNKYQNTQEMKACVAAGKVWKVEKTESDKGRSISFDRVCVTP
jgi:hypothetical protein